MKMTIHERFRLRPGMRVRLQEGVARVVRVSVCAAVCQIETPRVRAFRTVAGEDVQFAASGRLVRLSPNAEVEVL